MQPAKVHQSENVCTYVACFFGVLLLLACVRARLLSGIGFARFVRPHAEERQKLKLDTLNHAPMFQVYGEVSASATLP